MYPNFRSVDNPRQFICVFGVPCGSINETAEKSGISHVVEHMLFTKANVVERMQKYGMTYNAVTSMDYTIFYIACDSAHCVEAFTILQSVVMSLDLTAARFKKEIRVVKEELAISGLDSNYFLFQLLHQNTPYFSSVIGSSSSLDSITLDDVRGHYDKHFRQGSIASIVACHPKWESRIRKACVGSAGYNPVPMMDLSLNRVVSESAEKVFVVRKTNRVYESGQIGFLGYPAFSARNMSCKLAAYILHFRIYNILREKYAYVYVASCSYTPMMHSGYFCIKFNRCYYSRSIQFFHRIRHFSYRNRCKAAVTGLFSAAGHSCAACF